MIGRATLMLLATLGPALAQPPLPAAPRIRPMRDVVVTYVLEGEALAAIPGGVKGPVRLSWDAAGQRVRLEAEGRSQVALMDLKAHSGEAFDTGLRIVLPLPVREKDIQPLTLDQLQLTPHGRETVAGLSCNAFTYATAQGPGSVCLTPDGVPLKGKGLIQGKPGSFLALSVAYGPLPASLFTVPQGYISLGGGGASSGGLAGLAAKLGGGGGLGDLRSLLGHAR